MAIVSCPVYWSKLETDGGPSPRPAQPGVPGVSQGVWHPPGHPAGHVLCGLQAGGGQRVHMGLWLSTGVPGPQNITADDRGVGQFRCGFKEGEVWDREGVHGVHQSGPRHDVDSETLELNLSVNGIDGVYNILDGTAECLINYDQPLQVYVTFTNGRDCRVKWRCLAQNKVKLAAASSQLYATRLLHSTFWNASSSG
ncbi:hypothetical protein JTE90_023181 [Oedothorax gibbosus]|uniref:Uncharacterized protein n=2 Tax=Oedothorax gibbosus TaxID=931172 RepID=A0AAV6UI46_9ARAC|nr:hypothetical protein JTE90_023181 [Oedothorax gibbosus]